MVLLKYVAETCEKLVRPKVFESQWLLSADVVLVNIVGEVAMRLVVVFYCPVYLQC